MENVCNYGKTKLTHSWEQAKMLIATPEFKSTIIFSENVTSVELWSKEIIFNKPLYVGMCILELRKTMIYNFHYIFITT